MSKFEVKKNTNHKYQAKRVASIESEDDDDDSYQKQLQWNEDLFPGNRKTRPPPTTSRYHVSQRLRRIDLLAKPKVRQPVYEKNEPYRVRPSALTYNASDRLSDLAMPKRVHARTPTSVAGLSTATDPIGRPSPFILSERLQALAQPRKQRLSEDSEQEKFFHDADGKDRPMARIHSSDEASNHMNRLQRLSELTRIPKHKLLEKQKKKVGAVSHSALVCKASPRVEELAWPKVRREIKENEFAFNIKPSALKYNPTDRINDLAVARRKLMRSDYY